MKLLDFYPEGYRGLSKQPIYFTFAKEEPSGNQCSIRFLVGANGTGKSTILRFLASIFIALDEGYQHDRPENPAYGAPFRLRYRLHGDTIDIRTLGGGRNKLEFRINDEPYEGLPSGDRILPEALLIYTSGDINGWRSLLYSQPRLGREMSDPLPNVWVFDEEDQYIFERAELLSEYTQSPIPDGDSFTKLPQHSGQLNHISVDEGESDDGSIFDRITLVEPDHLPLAFLVACLAQIAEQEQKYQLGADFGEVLKHVHINRLVSFSIRVRYNPVQITESQRRRLEHLANAATVRLKSYSDSWLWVYDIDDIDESYDKQGPATKLMPELKLNPGQPYQLFQDLIRLYDDSIRAIQLPIQDRSLDLLEVNIIISKLSEQGETRFDKLLLFTDLSDGERAYLTRIALIHLLGQRESLFLLDEPETHFNDEWKRNLVDQVEQTLKNTESQVILTTHASIVLTDAYPEEIILLDEQGQQSVPLTFAAEQNELLRSVFGADRSVGRRAMNRVNHVIKHGTAEQLRELLKQVGPGYYRYKIIEALERRVSQD